VFLNHKRQRKTLPNDASCRKNEDTDDANEQLFKESAPDGSGGSNIM
jgi:hypothetical protein